MTISIFASFTICGIFGIDLAGIPSEMYPIVIVVIGLENMYADPTIMLLHTDRVGFD